MASHRWSGPVLVALLVAATIVPVLGAAATGPPPARGSPGGASSGTATIALPTLATQTDNTTQTPVPHHGNPENRSQAGTLGMYERWLADRMGEMLVDCTTGSRARQVGVCDLQGEYTDLLDNYVDVTGETATTADDETAETYEEAGKNLHDFDSDVERFRRSYEAYREARAAGNTSRARRLARRLTRLARDINRTAGSLHRDFDRIADTSRVSLNESSRTLTRIDRNTTTVANEVQAASFVRTRLSVRANASETSFRRPLVVTGRLVTENGSAVADRSIRIAISGREFRTQTDADGQFTVRYRPTVLSLNATTVSVRYVPRNVSTYLGSAATLPVTVSQVEPAVTVSRSPAVVTFGKTVEVTGTVVAGGVAVPDVPVVVAVTGAPGRTVRTAPNGTYRTRLTVPASVADGTRTVRATVSLDDRAIQGASATTTVTVRETPTMLTIQSSVVDGAGAVPGRGTADRVRVRVTGHLRTDDGHSLDGQPIRLTLNGTTVGTVQTGRDGTYGTTVPVPRRLIATQQSNTSIRVLAQFGAPGTNLAPTRSTTTVQIPGEPAKTGFLQELLQGVAPELLQGVATVSDRLPPLPWWQWGLVGITPLAVLGALVLGWREVPFVRKVLGPFVLAGRTLASVLWLPGGLQSNGTGEQHAAASSVGDGSAATAGPGTDSEPAPAAGDSDGTPLARARQHLESGDTDDAIRTAYAVGRDRLSTEVAAAPRTTHWEFYETATERIGTEDAEAFRRLTEAYEAATFAPTPVETDVAHGAIDAAERVRDVTEGPPD